MSALTGKVALVTGGSRGIGAATCRELARQGARVIVNYRARRDAAEQVVTQIDGDGGQAFAVESDVSSRWQVEAMVDTAIARFGQCDILVNNAGIDVDASVQETTDDQWDQLFAVNARGCFLCTQVAARRMIDRGHGGRIVNVTSVNARLGWRNRAAYSATKGAIEAFTRCAAQDLGPHGITVNAVAPGAIRTEIWGETLTAAAERAQSVRLPLRHIGEPEDVASLIVYLVSPAARFVTGEVILVDGGRGTCDFLPSFET